MTNLFLTRSESEIGQRFLADGYVVVPVDDRDGLERIRDVAARLTADWLGIETAEGADIFLSELSEHIDATGLNELRLAVIDGLNAQPWMRPTYYGLARSALAALAGNELAMQRRINLSIQLPDDDSSLLPVHADVWSGDSPFEVVAWLPLVDCYATRSMYLLPPKANAEAQRNMSAFAGKSAEDLYRAIEKEVVFLDVPFGNTVVFSQNLMHGNRINRETGTRWSMNCRFKSVFSPYADKRLGEFFEPVTLRPATRIGLGYKLPEGFNG